MCIYHNIGVSFISRFDTAEWYVQSTVVSEDGGMCERDETVLNLNVRQ